MKQTQKGFTLVELVTVIIIIAILAGLALPQYARVMEKSRGAEARTTIGHIREMSLAYYNENGIIPEIANLGLGIPGTLGSEGDRSDCSTVSANSDKAASNFFHYYIVKGTGSSSTTAYITANRCQSGGKGPQGAGSTYIAHTINLATGAAVGGSPDGSGWSDSNDM